ncbi:MAG: porin family protein [Deltaproteobacteria bacterium]|nr:porin family protein [Deltaproteobacteria bacterium]MCL5277925.1 porin family protein [Deltaproteobacteria bacterium]
MERLLKWGSLVFSFITMLVMFIFNASTGYAGYDTATANNNHTGFYLGAENGYDIPTGPDEDGYIFGFGGALKLGYQFMRNLALELGTHAALGSITIQGNTPSGTQTAEGSWFFFQFPFLDLKPIIPLSVRNNLYFIAGIALSGFLNQTTNQPPTTAITSTGAGYDIGMGFEGYITNHISLGGEMVYHNFTNNKFNISSGGVSENVTGPYIVNMSFTSLNFVFLYHF